MLTARNVFIEKPCKFSAVKMIPPYHVRRCPRHQFPHYTTTANGLLFPTKSQPPQVLQLLVAVMPRTTQLPLTCQFLPLILAMILAMRWTSMHFNLTQ